MVRESPSKANLHPQVNILMKNVVDVVLGGLTYWAFGYGLSYGDSPLSNRDRDRAHK